jgi:hypothetical protein
MVFVKQLSVYIGAKKFVKSQYAIICIFYLYFAKPPIDKKVWLDNI